MTENPPPDGLKEKGTIKKNPIKNIPISKTLKDLRNPGRGEIIPALGDKCTA